MPPRGGRGRTLPRACDPGPAYGLSTSSHRASSGARDAGPDLAGAQHPAVLVRRGLAPPDAGDAGPLAGERGVEQRRRGRRRRSAIRPGGQPVQRGVDGEADHPDRAGAVDRGRSRGPAGRGRRPASWATAIVAATSETSQAARRGASGPSSASRMSSELPEPHSLTTKQSAPSRRLVGSSTSRTRSSRRSSDGARRSGRPRAAAAARSSSARDDVHGDVALAATGRGPARTGRPRSRRAGRPGGSGRRARRRAGSRSARPSSSAPAPAGHLGHVAGPHRRSRHRRARGAPSQPPASPCRSTSVTSCSRTAGPAPGRPATSTPPTTTSRSSGDQVARVVAGPAARGATAARRPRRDAGRDQQPDQEAHQRRACSQPARAGRAAARGTTATEPTAYDAA